MSLLVSHPQREAIRKQLARNIVLRTLKPRAFADLERFLHISDHKKGDLLLRQGEHDMVQYFILDGVLKRVVANPEGKEMILRFSKEDDMDTSYAAWRLRTPAPYSIRAVTKARIAHLPMEAWVEFLDRHPIARDDFEYEVMHLMSEVMAHTITLHLLDAAGRVQRFLRKYPDLYGRVPMKELASHLNLSAETLSRLKQKGKFKGAPVPAGSLAA
ncbi:MAG: Crp/Fnr family transcriptional regulator [Betaproteobacteria bacterium]|nr:Crp/Fnr family transcriptional regulator [Betaproteobacteria bacterium]